MRISNQAISVELHPDGKITFIKPKLPELSHWMMLQQRIETQKIEGYSDTIRREMQFRMNKAEAFRAEFNNRQQAVINFISACLVLAHVMFPIILMLLAAFVYYAHFIMGSELQQKVWRHIVHHYNKIRDGKKDIIHSGAD
jgi:hypothetical protein